MPESIGKRIKELRTQQGMTLADLGEKVKLSTSYLSQIERDKTAPSLPTLMDIARALDVSPRHFFETDVEAAYIQRADRGLPDPSSSPLVLRQRLTPEGGNNKLEAFRVILQLRASLDQPDTFSGEEFCFVLAGEFTIGVGDEQFVLEAGDSIHYDAFQPRYWRNSGEEPCVVIGVRVADPQSP